MSRCSARPAFLGAEIKRFERKAADAFRLDPRHRNADVRPHAADRAHQPPQPERHSGRRSRAARDRRARAASDGARVLIDEVYLDAAAPRAASAVHLGPSFVCTNSLTKVLRPQRPALRLDPRRAGARRADVAAERTVRSRPGASRPSGSPASRSTHLDEVIGGHPAPCSRATARSFNAFVAGARRRRCCAAEHGITAFPRWAGGDTERSMRGCASDYDAAIVPGRWFEMPDHFRIGFGLPTDDVRGGL